MTFAVFDRHLEGTLAVRFRLHPKPGLAREEVNAQEVLKQSSVGSKRPCLPSARSCRKEVSVAGPQCRCKDGDLPVRGCSGRSQIVLIANLFGVDLIRAQWPFRVGMMWVCTLFDVRDEVNPDQMPRLESPALKVDLAAVPPSDGVLNMSAEYVGAFGTHNWLEGWTSVAHQADCSEPSTAGVPSGLMPLPSLSRSVDELKAPLRTCEYAGMPADRSLDSGSKTPVSRAAADRTPWHERAPGRRPGDRAAETVR